MSRNPQPVHDGSITATQPQESPSSIDAGRGRSESAAQEHPIQPVQEDWSVQRRLAYAKTSEARPALPMARIEIPAVGLSAMVLEGTDAITLNRGVGHIEGTSFPGEPGNVGIAGHRDGYFRRLGKIHRNDAVLLTTRNATYRYHVDLMAVVEASDASFLANDTANTLTLVTCFPLNFLGPAPKRLIVRALLDGEIGN